MCRNGTVSPAWHAADIVIYPIWQRVALVVRAACDLAVRTRCLLLFVVRSAAGVDGRRLEASLIAALRPQIVLF